jgi:hypothetical protein
MLNFLKYVEHFKYVKLLKCVQLYKYVQHFKYVQPYKYVQHFFKCTTDELFFIYTILIGRTLKIW